jgi:hypothetical protein
MGGFTMAGKRGNSQLYQIKKACPRRNSVA